MLVLTTMPTDTSWKDRGLDPLEQFHIAGGFICLPLQPKILPLPRKLCSDAAFWAAAGIGNEKVIPLMGKSFHSQRLPGSVNDSLL